MDGAKLFSNHGNKSAIDKRILSNSICQIKGIGYLYQDYKQEKQEKTGFVLEMEDEYGRIKKIKANEVMNNYDNLGIRLPKGKRAPDVSLPICVDGTLPKDLEFDNILNAVYVAAVMN